MTTKEFNALPVEARRFISAHSGCLGCGGNAAEKLTKAYGLYKTQKKMTTYKLHGGGINFSKNGQGGVLYPISSEDSADDIRRKISTAKEIHTVSPHVFTIFDEAAMDALVESLEPAEVVDLDQAKKPVVKMESPTRAGNGKFQKKQVAPAEDEI
jgi:hypothetical protein